jgi:glycosyltransferase involved in cell wall biosynthesis
VARATVEFITWNDSRRSASLARVLGIPRRLIRLPERSWRRHAVGILRTAIHLALTRPSIVWFQVSYGLGCVLLLYRFLSQRRVVLVADAHSKALRRSLWPPGRWLFHSLKRAIFRSVSCIVVANRRDRAFCLSEFSCRAVVLPDPLPVLSERPDQNASSSRKVVCICSFAKDEPLDLVMELGSRLGGPSSFACTGDYRKLGHALLSRLEAAVELTGHLPDARYWETLISASAIVVLSTEPACVPCGAYEALAIGRRPVVLEGPAVQAVLADLAICTSPDPAALELSVRTAMREQPDSSLSLRFAGAWDSAAQTASAEFQRVGAISRLLPPHHRTQAPT